MKTTPQPIPTFQALTATLAPYLAAGIEVESAAHGRGVLVGLPYSQKWECAQAEVRFEGSMAFNWDVYQLDKLKPVLWHADDYLEAIDAVAGKLPMHWQTLCLAPAEDLEEMAAVVDAARALGIALNLPAGSYIRKEVQGDK